MLFLYPNMAKAIGLHESLIVAFVMKEIADGESIKNDKNVHQFPLYIFHDGYCWIRLTLNEWEDHFPFWNAQKIQRTLSKVEKMGILVSIKKNENPFDQTKSYRVNHNLLSELISGSDIDVDSKN